MAPAQTNSRTPTRRAALRVLRDQLVDIYPERLAIRRVVDDAGLAAGHIDFNGAAIDVWQAVLARAVAENRLAALVQVASKEFPERAEELRQAYERVATARRDPPSPRAWLTVAAALAVIAGGWLGLRWWQARIEPMPATGSFNVGVAHFPILDPQGRQIDPCISAKISDYIYRTVVATPSPAAQQLLTDSRGPAVIHVIDGADDAARQMHAVELADRINATIFLHGTIAAAGNRYQLQPEFYISRAENSFTYASEIAGPDRLGESVAFELPPTMDCASFDPQQVSNLNRELADRVEGLRRMVAGLREFYSENYELAYDQFDRMAHLAKWQPDDPGQEVVNLLRGAAKLRTYDPASDPGDAQRALQAARSAFEEALRVNPGYSRAAIGLGSVALEEAKTYDAAGLTVTAVDGEKLAEAGRLFEAGRHAPDQPARTYIREKAALGIGSAHLLGFEHHLAGWSGRTAYDLFGEVIATYEQDNSPALLPIAAQAYCLRGRLEGHNGQWAAMATACRRAIELLEQPGVMPDRRSIAVFWAWIALADESQGQLCRALDDYRQALDYGAGSVAGTQLTVWEQERERLQAAAEAAGGGCE